MNRTALITGASSGIGEAFAVELAKQGYDVVLLARSKDKLEDLAARLEEYPIRIETIVQDLSVEYAAKIIKEKVEKYGLSIDFLVNNAGFGTSGEFLSNTMELDHQQVMVNVASVLDLTHVFLPSMVERGHGTIINLASLISFVPMPYMSVYGATKAFVLAFSQTLAEEYRHKGIDILALCPGPTETKFFEVAGSNASDGMKMRTCDQVVKTAFRALANRKSVAIDGFANTILAQLPRFVSRSSLTKVIGRQMRKRN
ncbi:SDR family NAD(P)-dependent oxidoreductase [Shimazuella kribbensis]|uniref:SDR family NAD(P)-dependent oxidoreductase n=1 Tax=Shimazuella kribbensis TaxID=139808 RepID=UPI000401BD6F|nr:SDR family oxidoreductase [Shimazuella kribbensis]